MTDWLDDILDAHPGDAPPEGFAAGVTEQARRESGGGAAGGRLLAFPRLVAAAAAGLLLLATGYWLGRGAPDLDGIRLSEEPQAAELGLDEIWRDRELLESLDTLSAEELELAFRDATAGTWILDEALPVEESGGEPEPGAAEREDGQ